MAEQFTTMVLNVDLQCCKCFKKVKKVLCKYPQIRDQIYDVKQNTVTIKVVCCCPEKIMQKIRCKGGKSIKSIEIKPPEKPQPKPQPQPQPQPEQQPKPEPEQQPKPEPQPKPQPQPQPPQPAPNPHNQTPVYLPVYPLPSGVCCRECYEGREGGPCEQLGYGRPPPCYDGCYGRPIYDSWGGGCYRGYGYYHRSRCDYFSEENPSACKIM